MTVPASSSDSPPDGAPTGQRPRVAYLLTHYPKLAQTFIRSEIEGLERRGFEVFPFAMNAPSPGDLARPSDRVEMQRTIYLKRDSRQHLGTALAHAARQGLGPTLRQVASAVGFGGIQLKSKTWRVFHLAEALMVWDHCERSGVRHIHAQFAGPSATIAMLAARLGNALSPGTPWTFSMTIHGSTDFQNEDEIGLRAKLAEASLLVVISDFLRSQCMRVTDHRDWHKIEVVKVGIDLDQFSLRTDEPESEVPHVTIVGRLSEEKGHLILLEAVAELLRRGCSLHVDVVGDGPLSDELRRATVELDICRAVQFHGELPQSAVHDLLQQSTLFCLPSFSEGIPVSIMEAMASGVPVVTTAIMGIPELVIDGVTGFAVTASRSDLLADAIERCLSDANLRAKLVAAGRDRVATLHNLDTNLDRLALLFRERLFDERRFDSPELSAS